MAALTIGLTGGIASGKSFVADAFIALGVPFLEADEVARAVVAPGEPALAEIVRIFGGDMLLADGGLNRRRLREIVFADANALRQLESITHPAIRSRVSHWRAAQTADYCVYSAAILIESGMTAQVDRVLLIDATEAEQMRRLMRRDDVDEALAARMLAAQAARATRLARADDVIDNTDTDRDPLPQVRRLHRFYSALAVSHRP
jgi:dephospho-CoA kinase